MLKMLVFAGQLSGRYSLRDDCKHTNYYRDSVCLSVHYTRWYVFYQHV